MINLSSLLGGGMLLKQQIITETGLWVRPSRMSGNDLWVTLIGGGCGGNVAAGVSSRGGGGGQYKYRVNINIALESSVLCTIGSGGIASNTVTSNPGNPTSFGAYLSALGGSNSSQPFGAPGGQGKSTGALDMANNGSDSPYGYGGRSTNIAIGGGGAGLVVGPNPPSVIAVIGSGAQGYGAGGSSGSVSGQSSSGLSGVILIEWPEFV